MEGIKVRGIRKRAKSLYLKEKKYYGIRILVVIFSVILLISFLIWQNIEGLELENEIRRGRAKWGKLYREYYEQRILYERLRSREVVEEYAREKLRMVSPGRGDYIKMGIRGKEELLRKFGLEDLDQ